MSDKADDKCGCCGLPMTLARWFNKYEGSMDRMVGGFAEIMVKCEDNDSSFANEIYAICDKSLRTEAAIYIIENQILQKQVAKYALALEKIINSTYISKEIAEEALSP